jgi:hypothetical protein
VAPVPQRDADRVAPVGIKLSIWCPRGSGDAALLEELGADGVFENTTDSTDLLDRVDT